MVDFGDLPRFAEFVTEISDEIGFRVSSRGWAYILEQKRYINKDEFDKVSTAINKCRKKGLLPIDFTADESSRDFMGVEIPDDNTVVDQFGGWLRGAEKTAEYYTPDWWDGEEYYIQMVVEKVDLVTLFRPVCRKYHIPIANSKGWSSMLQRAEYARRYAEARDKGLKCVLLYCGDHDPDGLRISDFIRKNLRDLKDIEWADGTLGYDPYDLIIDRFGLNYDFIIKNGFTWIDNLITGSGKNLANPNHKFHNMEYVQDYLKRVGARKCEANSIIVHPEIARKLAQDAIEKYVGKDAPKRFEVKRQEVRDELNGWFEESGTNDLMKQIIDKVDEYNEGQEDE